MYYKKKHCKKNIQGFTLIELLTIIAVTAVLAGGIIVAINPLGQEEKARDAQRKNDLHQIMILLNLYYDDHNKYPPATNSGVNCTYGSNCQVWSTTGTSWISALVPTYAGKLPIDPINSGDPRATGTYAYAYGDVSADGQHYNLYTQLENQQDPQRCGLKDYMYDYGFSGGPIPWCAGDSGNSFGGSKSNYIFQINHE